MRNRAARVLCVVLMTVIPAVVASWTFGQEPPAATVASSTISPEILAEWKIQAREDVERYGAMLKEWKLKAREATSLLEIAQDRLNHMENTTAKGYTPKVMVRTNQAERLTAEGLLLACETRQKDAEVHFNRATRKLARLEKGTADPLIDAPDSVSAIAQIVSDLNFRMDKMTAENVTLKGRLQNLERKLGVGG
ncbi:hypothetical protein EP7_001678 [Isosphaeraceae bacterium EP7]